MKNTIKYLTFVFLLTALQSIAEVEKVIPTMLKVTVLDKIGNPVEGAEVTLYNNAKDYEKEENPVQTVVSNARGKAFFKGLLPQEYYIQVEKGVLSNIGGGEITNELLEGRINKLNIIIE